MVKVLHVEDVPIDSIEAHPENPNVGDVDAIAESLTQHEQYVPLTVDSERGWILRGNHTWKAMVRLEWQQVRVQWLECTYEEGLAIMLADNRIAELATRSDDAIAEVLAKLPHTVGIGYTQDDIDEIVARVNPPDKTHSTGELLKALDVTLGEPRIQVLPGDRWQVGPHTLVCVDVFTGWPDWAVLLEDPERQFFAPYPGPFAPLGKNADKWEMLLVQPDPYIASHIATMYADANGDDQVEKL